MSSQDDDPIVAYLIDHLFLPPRISEDWLNTACAVDKDSVNRVNQAELGLLSFVRETVHEFRKSEVLSAPTEVEGLKRAEKMLRVMQGLQASLSSSPQLESLLMQELTRMQEGDVIALHVQARNAAIMFRHCGPTVTFLSFEASLPPSDVLASPERLKCSYPSTTVSIPAKTFYLQNFLQQLTKFLSSLNAASFATESHSDRDIAIHEDQTFPGCLLQAVGGHPNLALRSGHPEVIVFKSIADEVLLAGTGKEFACAPDRLPPSSEVPCTTTWRRSPIWLVLRVTLQITLLNPLSSGASSRSNPHWGYKILILYILTALLGSVIRPDDPKWSSEHLSHMSRKVAHRAAKLERSGSGLTIPTILRDFVSKEVCRAADILNMRFKQVQATAVNQLNWPLVAEIEAHQDIELKMVNSRSYIESILAEYHDKAATPEEVPTSFPKNGPPRIYHATSRSQMIFRCGEKLEGFAGVPSLLWTADTKLMWKDIELWVETTLESFVTTNSKCEEACCRLSRLLASYTDTEHILYYPVDDSLSILTALELWVAIDRIAVSIIPLLKEYPCEIDTDDNLFTVLLLPKKSQIERLQKVRTYLQNRESEATYPSIFQGYRRIESSTEGAMPVDCSAFSVRYFDQSLLHQTLRDTIVTEVCELTAMNRKKKRAKLDLPFASDTPQAKAIVFELDPPVVFATWRDATFRAALRFPRFSKPRKGIFSHDNFIPNDEVLARHYSPKSTLILGAVYCRESLENTRVYTSNAAGAMDIDWSSVGLHYVMLARPSNPDFEYERHMVGGSLRRLPLAAVIGSCQRRVQGFFTFYLNLDEYGCLNQRDQYEPGSSIHKGTFDELSPNSAVQISQHDLPDIVDCNWLQHQYYAFNIMLFGSRLRWLNMLREIKAHNPCLNSNNADVLHAFLQACWQTGPQVGASTNTETYLWETHEILRDVDFCNQILDELESTLTVIKATWLQCLAMQVIISLGARVLSLALASQIQMRAAYFLRLCRAVCMDWLVEISRCIKSSIGPPSQEEWRVRGLLVAVTCRQTFDVDLDVSVAVFNSERDLGDFIQCSAWPSLYGLHPWGADSLFCEEPLYTSVHSEEISFVHEYLLARDERIAHSMEPHLRHLVFTNNDWFHSAITRIMPAYIPDGEWNMLAAPNDRWITTISGGSVSVTLHYNLLEGTLFVNGELVGHERLPGRYTQNPLYRRVFGSGYETFMVSKADMPGMEFRTVSVSDPKLVLYFGMRGENLIIRTKRGADVYEIISHIHLKGDFPETLLDSYLHLLDLNQQKLEFRPLRYDASIWDTANSDWVITISKPTKQTWSAHGHRTLPCGRELRMIDYHSRTQASIAEIFQSIERKKYIELTFCPKKNKVYLALIRYKLKFAFDGTQTGNSQIACQTFPGMLVDMRPRNGQDIQTLYGLKTYLVLREAQIPPPHGRRTVIIPDGEVLYSPEKYHTSVRINLDHDRHIAYHLYSVDHLLGRLVSNGDSESLLYLSYLHALTSYCLPDPLTGLTGTQQALENLQSAGVWNSRSRCTSGLELLRSLAPQQRHYISRGVAPKALAVQLVVPSPIGYQYAELYVITESIQRGVDGSDPTSTPSLFFNDQGRQGLQERAAIKEVAYIGRGKQTARTMQSLLPPHNVKGPPAEPLNIPSHKDLITNVEVADFDPLKTLLDRFSSSTNGFQRQYSTDLEKSWKALHTANKPPTVGKPLVTLPSVQDMESYVLQSFEYLQALMDMVAEVLAPGEGAPASEALLELVGLQPRISIKSILLQLREINKDEFKVASAWKQILVSFGTSITLYQRARRMFRAMCQRDIQLFIKEWENKGHLGWDPQRFPEWILFEIENDLLIRPMQAKIAMEMITPRTEGNFVMQLNMGEGKSSVIVPIVAASLANGQSFVRVVVLRPLWNQMHDLLVHKLGGLLNRRIYYVPISRQEVCQANSGKISFVSQIRDIFRECQENGGIFLTQPEHLLSFKLIIAESLCTEKDSQLLDELLKTQHWLDEYARDIFDESDELFHSRYELIHTTGRRQPLELGAERWGMVSEVFDAIRKHIPKLKKEYPSAIDLIERKGAPGSFPFVRLLEKDAELKLMREIAVNIITDNLMKWLPAKHIHDGRAFELIFNYVIDKNAKDNTLSEFGEIPPPVLLLKGLIGHEVIGFVLREKRWRVDYGLHNSKLAIPYRAKDSPVMGAQFAHPDITIALTCLCYYYQGLTESQLRSCFHHLKDVRNPEAEYHFWIKECRKYLPPYIWHLDGANLALEDTYQWPHTLYPILKLSKRIIDFYLSFEVFPFESQGFASKLSTSAWDLAEKRAQPTTGFSGSNDNRYLLPLSIEQFDLDSQVHTNAKVLSYLLRPENRFYQCVQTIDGERLSGRELILRMVEQQTCSMGQIQVLVDVGAQVLDVENKDTAQYWLSEAAKRGSKWTAALFFNADGQLTVIDKEGRVQPYRLSPYAATENMARCLVYLDEAHTRGTDIKLPGNSVAAVTLGPRLTKDKLVQACMRMRNLGYGQSVCFFAPPEVDQKIRNHSLQSRDADSQDRQIGVIDILSWAMHETCIQTEQNLALWASHGIAYQTRQSASRCDMNSFNQESYIGAWIEAATESKTLTEMYSTSNGAESNSLFRIIERKMNDPLCSRKQELGKIKVYCENYQIPSFRNTSLEQLQEREVARWQEHRREVEHPRGTWLPYAEACTHELHPSLPQFIETSAQPLPPNIPGSPFRTLVQTLEQTSFRDQIGEDPWTAQILTTVDFSTSLAFARDTSMSDLESRLETGLPLQPVTWVMSTRALHDGNHLTFIIISPFEANELLPAIRKSNFVNLYMYSPRMQNAIPAIFDLVAGPTPPFLDKHRIHSIHTETEELLIQLNLYAGELFFDSYEMYRKTCAFLGCDIGKEPTPSSIGWKRPQAEFRAGKQDDAIQVSGNKMGTITAQLPRNRWEFLQHLAKLRAGGINIKHTHMGCLLRGEILQEKDWSKERVVDISTYRDDE